MGGAATYMVGFSTFCHFVQEREFFRVSPALAPPCVGGIVAGMKVTFIALLAVLLCVGGCGKKKVEQTAKETPKTKEAPEKSNPKPPPIKPGTVL